MNGNATVECDWLPPSGSHSGTSIQSMGTSEVYRERRLAVGPLAHPSEEGGSVILFFPLPRYGSRAGTSWLRSGRGSPPESMAAGIAQESEGEAETCQRW